MSAPVDIPVIVLFGATASGKTGILLNLFAESGRAEVVSADSMQVYRGMDIGTAKPSFEERARLVHHLLDIRDPGEQFNVGDFVRLAESACLNISHSGKLPVISGGTGFYIKNFIMGLPEAPPSDEGIRGLLRAEWAEKGARPLMDELRAGDPVSAERIHINDTYRLLRALEVLRLCGRPLSSFPVSGGKAAEASGSSAAAPEKNRAGGARPLFRFLVIALSRPREELYHRINLRCASMFARGLPDEVASLFKAGYTPQDPGLKAIGYREFFVEDCDSDSGEKQFRLSCDINGVQALVAQNSRRYAKRQYTFFKGIPDVQWIEAGDDEAQTAALIHRKIENFLRR